LNTVYVVVVYFPPQNPSAKSEITNRPHRLGITDVGSIEWTPSVSRPSTEFKPKDEREESKRKKAERKDDWKKKRKKATNYSRMR
jgi:hypothetical protein